MCASRAPPVVLVVEDQGLIRLLIAEALQDAGWLVHEADTGERATYLFQVNHVDVVFTDIELGGTLSGWEIAERFRVTHPELGVIYTSGKPPEEAKKVTKSTFFAKPYDTAKVVAECIRLTP